MVQPRQTFTSVTYPSGTYQQVSVEFTPENDPSPQGRFWAYQFGTAGGDGGYFGLQTLGSDLGGKAVVFSIANALSGSGTGIVTNEFDGAPGVSTRKSYPWVPDRTYRFVMTRGSDDGTGRWWSAAVTDLSTGGVTPIASIKVPSAWGALTNFAVLFGEHYTPAVADCEDILFSSARWQVLRSTPLGGGTAVAPINWSSSFDQGSPCGDGAIVLLADGVRHQMGSGLPFNNLRRVRVVSSTDVTGQPEQVLDPQDGGYYQEDESDVGAFSLTLPESDPATANVTADTYVKFYVTNDNDDVPDWSTAPVDFTGVVERVSVVVRDRNPGQQVRTVTGRSLFAELERFLVQPPLGRFNKPTPLEVRFDWTHPGNRGGIPGMVGAEPERPGLIFPTFQGSVFTADEFIAGGTFPASPQGRVNAAPEGWPDAFGAWIWSRAVDGNDAHPEGVSYFFGIIETNQLPLIVTWAADNNGQLAINGAVVDSGATPPASQWRNAVAIGIPEVSVGATYVHARVENRSPYGPNNPGGFAMCAHQPLVNERFVFDNCIARTGNGVTQLFVNGDGTGNRTRNRAGGGWKCLDYPASPPGFTVGKAMRWLFQTIVTYGGSTGWTLGFSDTLDSNNNPWPVTDALTARVNDTIAEVCRQWSAQGHASFAVDRDSRTLLAYRWREQGTFPLSSATWGDDELSLLRVEERS